MLQMENLRGEKARPKRTNKKKRSTVKIRVRLSLKEMESGGEGRAGCAGAWCPSPRPARLHGCSLCEDSLSSSTSVVVSLGTWVIPNNS